MIGLMVIISELYKNKNHIDVLLPFFTDAKENLNRD